MLFRSSNPDAAAHVLINLQCWCTLKLEYNTMQKWCTCIIKIGRMKVWMEVYITKNPLAFRTRELIILSKGMLPLWSQGLYDFLIMLIVYNGLSTDRTELCTCLNNVMLWLKYSNLVRFETSLKLNCLYSF